MNSTQTIESKILELFNLTLKNSIGKQEISVFQAGLSQIFEQHAFDLVNPKTFPISLVGEFCNVTINYTGEVNILTTVKHKTDFKLDRQLKPAIRDFAGVELNPDDCIIYAYLNSSDPQLQRGKILKIDYSKRYDQLYVLGEGNQRAVWKDPKKVIKV